jgi:benzoyl-CoA reductase/2-hydroxyglutaryl-CoA dehydratase subunit BcrC/BadD/HgdB
MLTQAIDQLVQAIEAALVLNPELLDQSDPRKADYWRKILCPAIQKAKEEKKRGITRKELHEISELLRADVEQYKRMQELKDCVNFPSEMVNRFTNQYKITKPLLDKVTSILATAEIEEMVA